MATKVCECGKQVSIQPLRSAVVYNFTCNKCLQEKGYEKPVGSVPSSARVPSPQAPRKRQFPR